MNQIDTARISERQNGTDGRSGLTVVRLDEWDHPDVVAPQMFSFCGVGPDTTHVVAA